MALAFAAVYLLWGSTYLGMKVAIQSFPPLLVGGMRFSAAGLTLLLAQALLGKVEPAWLRSPRYWRSALLCGGLMLLVANGLLAASLHRVGTGTAALGVALTPVWLVLFDRWQTGRSHLAPKVLAGLVLGVLGVTLLSGAVTDPGRALGGEAIGMAMVVVSTLGWASGSILGRRVPQPRRTLVGTSMQMIAGGALMMGASFAFESWTLETLRQASLRGWLAVAYLAVAGSLLGFTAYVWLLKNAPAARVATYAYVNPLVALALGWWWLGEVPSRETWIAAPLILGGVVLLQSGSRTPPPPSVTPRSTSPEDDGR